MKKGRTTIKDIAKMAGVSRGTVDRVINKRGNVETKKRDRILKIAFDLGYKKNIVASNLARNKAFVVFILIPRKQYEPYWEIVYKGIESAISTLEVYDVKCVFHEYDVTSSTDYISNLKEVFKGEADFILIAPVFLKQTQDFFSDLDQKHARVLTINSEIEEQYISGFIGQNSFTTGLVAGKLFQKNIHKINPKILCVTVGHEVDNSIHIKKKIDGLLYYANETNTKFDIAYLNIRDFQNEENVHLACQQVELDVDYFDGIFFTNSRAAAFVKTSKYFNSKKAATCVIGFDLTSENIELLNNGSIDYLLDEQPFEQGRQAMLHIFDVLLFNKEIQAKKYLPVNIIIKENIDAYMV